MAKNYLTGEFILDVVAALPYTVIRPRLIFVRYLKFRKIGIYQGYVDELIEDLASNFMNN